MPVNTTMHLASPHERRPELQALVLAGGFGRRLEPLIHRLRGEAIPKQFCDFGSGRSLLQRTIDRIAPLLPNRRVTVVVDRSQLARARAQLDRRCDVRLVDQPCERGTAAGILFPLLQMLRSGRDPIVVLLPSDHGIAGEDDFLCTVAAARDVVELSPDAIVLLGAEPGWPSTDYGWIVHDRDAEPLVAPATVKRFIEKPELRRAVALFRSGRSLWNTMILVARATALLRLSRRRVGHLVDMLETVLAGSDVPVPVDAYQALPRADFCADVLGGSTELSVLALPPSVGWSDLGTEQRLTEWTREHAGTWSDLFLDFVRSGSANLLPAPP